LYKPRFEFSGGTIHKVVFDVAKDTYFDMETHLKVAMARDCPPRFTCTALVAARRINYP
jgi:hypothetical protein